MTDENEDPWDGPVADGGIDSLETETPSSDERGPRGEETQDEDRPGAMPAAKREFILEVVRRASLLESLRAGPATTSELLESVEMSRSTLHRAINKLAGYDVVEEADGRYRLTNLGEILAAETETFGERASTAVSFSPFLNSINGSGTAIPVGHFENARVTRRRPRQPHCTIQRLIELFDSSDSLRMFSTVISPVYVDIGYQEMMDGMQIEAIFDREVLDIILAEFPEKANETVSTGNFTIHGHEGLPFELFIFDDRMGMAAHNKRGNAEVLVECDDPAAIEWAEDLYARYRSEAEPLLLSDL